jgi:protein transport protein SEC31
LNYTQSPTKFASIDWIDQLDEMGVIAGGMEDGAITLWSASKIMQQDAQKMGRGCLSAAQIHNGVPVKSLEFNPHKKNLLASGGSEVLL